MRRKHRKHRPCKCNNRERKQTCTGVSPEKRAAWERLFAGMTTEEIIAELKTVWVDCRYELIAEPIQEPEEDLFKDWEVYHA